MPRRHCSLRIGVLVFALAATLGWSRAASAQTRHVLLIHSFERDFAPLNVFSTEFRAEVSRLSPQPVEFIELSLQPARFSRSPEEEPIVRYVEATLAGRPLDLVVSLGGPAATFARKYRQRLFPTAPLLMGAVDRRLVRDDMLAPDETIVPV